MFGLALAAAFFYVGPFFWLWRGFFVNDAPFLWRAVVVFQVAVIIFVRWLTDDHFKEPAGSVLFHPLGLAFLLADALYAGGRFLVGAGVSHYQTIGIPVAMTSLAFVVGLALLPWGVETKGQPLPD